MNKKIRLNVAAFAVSHNPPTQVWGVAGTLRDIAGLIAHSSTEVLG